MNINLDKKSEVCPHCKTGAAFQHSKGSRKLTFLDGSVREIKYNKFQCCNCFKFFNDPDLLKYAPKTVHYAWDVINKAIELYTSKQIPATEVTHLLNKQYGLSIPYRTVIYWIKKFKENK